MMRALRHPALGLALIVLAVAQLPQHITTLGNILLDDYDVPLALSLPLVLNVAMLVAQALCGWAIAWRKRPGVWFAVYLAAAVALAISAAVSARGDDDFSIGVVIGGGVEAVGLPVLIALASLRYGDQLEDEPVAADVVALLLIFAVRSFVWTPLQLTTETLLVVRSYTDLQGLATMAIWPLIWLGVGIVALYAARRLAQSPASRALAVYARVAIVVQVGAFMVTIAFTMLGRSDYRRVLVLMQTASLTTLAVPIAVWLYGRPVLPAGAASRVPLWIALAYVPTLLIRVLVAGDMGRLIGVAPSALVIAIAATQGVLILLAFDAAVRRLASAARWLAAAAAVAALMFAVAAYYQLSRDTSSLTGLGPLSELMIAPAVAAWLYRR